jgi:hypothetical protein
VPVEAHPAAKPDSEAVSAGKSLCLLYGTSRLRYLSFSTVSSGLVADLYIVLALSDLQGLLMLLFVDMPLQRCRRFAAAFALTSLAYSGVNW